ncbi:unnamed protein product [Paramecium primaurelia]|uniref:SCP domain-containing protein n=1 Tax=Paramecium primaurelia TaxID=5886 RepID=A0A8S1PLG3_PARPR|nr:unnamed protein product [Paramecium primaurelia]
MKFVLIVFLAFVYAKVGCDTDNKERVKERGMSKKKEDELLELHNEHRNDVAVGKQKNWQGKFQTASNMNYVKWDNQLARFAQDCADKCPANFRIDCSFPPQYGFVAYLGDVENGGADWTAKRVFKKWAQHEDHARQIEMAQVQFFGCGRSQVSRKNGMSDEIVVCVYNRKPNLHGDVYKAGVAGQECLHGRKKGYLGLCKHSATDMSVLNFKHQKKNNEYKFHQQEVKHHKGHKHHKNNEGHKKFY